MINHNKTSLTRKEDLLKIQAMETIEIMHQRYI